MSATNTPLPDLSWVRSSLCESGQCVELAAVTVLGEPHIAIRDTEDPSLEVLTSEADFAKFLAGAKRGDFDHLVTS